MTALFITGTDTNCGKTFVAGLLINYFRQQQVNCIGLKPIASGCEWRHGKWVNEDIDQLMAANQSDVIINQWLFHAPIAPHFAALDAGIRMNAHEVISFCNQPQFMNFELRFIEGAGGLMVPLNEKETWIDVIKPGNMPLLVVVGIKLGCINQALQVNEVIKSYGLPAVGWIANVIDGHTNRIEDNINAIQSRIDMPLIGTVEHNASHFRFEKITCAFDIQS